ncbi:MAG: sortase [Dehalococcoidia bacterium]
MAAIRKHWFWGSIALVSLLLVMVGLDARPANSMDSATKPMVRTRPLHVETATAGLPREHGVPVLPATQEQPREFTFVAAESPVRLLPETDRIQLPGSVQRLVIPAISLDSEVVQVGLVAEGGTLQYETANFVVGQYRGVNPGQGDNVVLAGHVGTRNGQGGQVFRDLRKLELGDRLETYTDIGMTEYVVTEIRFVEPTATEIMAPTKGERLTLITCRNCNVDCQRLVVIAEPVRREEAA